MLPSRCCLPRPTCLAKAVVASGFLRRRGLAVEIVIGVTRDADSLLAHAWVEHSGRPAAGSPVARTYAPLVRLGGGRVG